MKNNILTQLVVGGIVVLAITAYYLVFRENVTLLVGGVGLVVLVALIFTRPEYGLPALLIVRPLVDSVGEYRIAVGNAGINIAGALSLIAIGWSIWVLVRQKSSLWTRELFRSMLLLVVISAISLSYSWAPNETVTELLRIAGFFLLYVAARELITDWPAFRRISLALAGSMVVPVLVGFFQVLTHRGLTFADSTNRAFGTFGHPNVMAFYLVLGISYFILTWPLLQTRFPSRWPITLVLTLALVLTQTRGAWAGLLVALAVISFVRFRRLFAGGFFALAMIVAILPTLNSMTTDVFGINLQAVPGIKEIIARQADRSSYQWRIDVWKDMGRRIQERPVFGFGLGAFPAVRSLQVFDFFQGVGAHNDYLRLIIELGLIGSLAYLALLTSIFVFLIRLYRFLKAHPLSLPVLGLIGFSVAFVVMSIFDNLLQATPVMWAYFILLGAVLNLAPRYPQYPKNKKPGDARRG